MNGEPPTIPQVPVTTLAGTVSLTELLPELPLPTPLVGEQSRSLLFHPRVAEEAQRHLVCQDQALVAQLAQALTLTSADHIEIKEQYAGQQASVDLKSAPPLLQSILKLNPAAFSGKGELVKAKAEPSQSTPTRNTQPCPVSGVPNHVNNVSLFKGEPQVKLERIEIPPPPGSYDPPQDSKGAGKRVKFSNGTGFERPSNSSLSSLRVVGNGDAIKKPVIKLHKLSTEELKHLSQTPPPVNESKAESNINKVSQNSTPAPKVSQNSSSKRKSRSGREVKTKYQTIESDSESEEDRKKPAKYFKSREKEREEKKKRDKAERKRNRVYSDDDEYDPSVEGRRQKRCKMDNDDDEIGDSEDDEELEEQTKGAKQSGGKRFSPKKIAYDKKRIERKLVGSKEKLSNEELMETGVYLRFTRAVEKIFDNAEDIDLTVEIEEDGDVPQEYLIPKYELSELCSETAKLKSLGATSLVPPERLVRLLNILEKNIRDGAKVTPIIDEDEDEDDRLWLELVMERILRGMDASLTVLYILTAPNMGKRVYLEDVIERCIQFAKFQLNNTIYPSFDPVYRVDNKKDGFIGNIKRKRAHVKDVRDRNILGLYNKLHELVGLIADLLSIQTLTDTTVLLLSTLGVAPFFVENVPELQLSSLRLVTKVFSKYDKHRRLLLDDILASIARLPSSKRSLRTYRLNSDENIQMLTALVLQLIQCVVELPEKLSKDSGSGNKSTGANSVAKENAVSKSDKSAGGGDKGGAGTGGSAANVAVDRDVLIAHKYETAMGTAYSFLSVFLQKTGSKNEEIDYRPLFENFVQDLLLTVNKPEWPASELLLSFLGKLLVQKFSNKNTDMTLRVSSLDCLGIVAARLRRDAVTSHLKVDKIDQIIREIKDEENRDAPILEDGSPPSAENGTTSTTSSSNSSKKSKKKKGSSKSEANDTSASAVDTVPVDEEEERTVFLQRVILDWLAVNTESETALLHARHFYIGQWYRDAYSEILRQKQGPISPKILSKKSSSSHKKKRRKRKGESSEEESNESEEDDDEGDGRSVVDEALNTEIMKLAERRKMFLLTKVAAFPPASPGARTQTLQTHIDYESAELITRYLASKRSFSQSFDSYLKQILRVLSESAIAVRTKAMKCLTMVVEADPAVLGRSDMQMGVHHSFLDHSTSVREAAVDLVGKFVLCRPELIHKYYEMIAARILDTGVSVRKRVIKIMKDICLEYPDFHKIPEICVKMIRRVNDEEGIKKLVQEVFQNMWFTPVKERPNLDKDALLLKVNNITEVVIACKDTGLDWFEQLLHSMFRPKEDKEDVTKINTEPPKILVTACKQIVDCLVNHILVLEEKGVKSLLLESPHSQSDSNKGFQTPDGQQEPPRSASQRLVACLKTLYLFAKIRPHLLVDYAITLQPYLSLKCQTQGDYTVIGVVARTLELVVPLMEHPSETFLSQLEEDAVKLILLHDRTVITSCVALLGSIVNTVTKNYRLIKDCFNKYYSFIIDYKRLHEENANDLKLEKHKPFFRRALYTVGLLLRHFDFNKTEVQCGLQNDITEHVVDTLMYFIDLLDMNIRFCTLQSLGSICIRHYDLMMSKRLKELYHHLLLDPEVNVQQRVQTLLNIETYLQEEEIRMIKQDQEWAKTKVKENLKEMCDIQSGMASTIIQLYLKQVLECVVAANVSVRQSALRVIQLVLAQGLVHPVQIVPYLICMSTDSEEIVAHSADKQLQDIEKKYPGFINMKAMQGFRLSYRLQNLIQPHPPTRGFKQKQGENPGAYNGFLYSIMRGTKQQRRAVAMSLLKQFDEHARIPLADLLYIADNLAYFPYQVIDEPLFIMHHIDVMISVTGSNLLQAFKESLKPPPGVEVKVDPETGKLVYADDDDEDDNDVEGILSRFPENLTPLVECMHASQGCLVMLVLKDHLKEVYGITDNKIWHYSPSDTSKQYEKSMQRKSNAKFNPKSTIVRLKEETKVDPMNMSDEDKKNLIDEYFAFKDLMLKIDREDDIDSDEETQKKTVTITNTNTNTNTTNHQVEPRMASRSQRLQQQADKSADVILLPGTHDGWEEKPDGKGGRERGGRERGGGHTESSDMNNTSDQQQQQQQNQRSPIKPITIRTSQLTPSSTPHKDKHHHHHHRSSSHHKTSHKKHKKKKKRKKYSDSDEEEEESDFSDPDFLV